MSDDDADKRDDDFPDEELTPRERKYLRRMIEADRRAHWFWHTSRLAAIYVSAALVALTTGYTLIQNVVKGLAK